MDDASLLGELRRATHEAHEALDRSLALHASDLTRERYVAFLQGSLDVVTPLERVLPIGDERSAALRADLATLGADASPASVALPPLAGEAEVLGATYVVEGSALGGVVLAKEVEGALGASALRYLRLHGGATGSAWKSFTAKLDAWSKTDAATPAARARACTAASAVFAAYAEAFASAFRRAGL